MAEYTNYKTLIHGDSYNSVQELWNQEINNSTVFQFGNTTTITYTYLQHLPSYYIPGVDEEALNGVFQPLSSQIDALNILLGNANNGYQSLYEDVANIVFSNVDNSFNADNVGALTFGGTLPSGDESGAPAYAFNPWTDSAGKKQGDVWIDRLNNNPFTTNFSQGATGFSILIHEIGHALGLEHPWAKTSSELSPHLGINELNNKYSIMVDLPLEYSHPDMYYRSEVDEGKYIYSLGLYDIAALQAIYGADTTTRAGHTTYKIGQGLQNANTPFIYTIWDGGGIDTIDTAGYADGVQIDLRQGHFSSIGKNGNPNGDRVVFDGGSYDAGNVAIAFHAVIENAVGTGENDIIIGNAWGNKLEGGGGDDFLYGSGFEYDGQEGFTDIDPNDANDPNRTKPVSDDDTFLGGEGNDYIYGGLGKDTADYSEDASGGGANRIIVSLDNNGDGIVIDGFGDTDTLHSVENIIGTSKADRFQLQGPAGRVIDGGLGEDRVLYSTSIVHDQNTDRVWGKEGSTYDTLENIKSVDTLAGRVLPQYSDDFRLDVGLGRPAYDYSGLHPGSDIEATITLSGGLRAYGATMYSGGP